MGWHRHREFNSGDISSLPYTKDGVTMTYSGNADLSTNNFFAGSGSFTTDLGNFTRIEASGHEDLTISGTGWSGATWTGNANSVSFGEFWGYSEGFTITFTIEAATPANACGDGVTWALDNGVLTISYSGSGTGAMADFTESYGSNPTPWKDNLYDITSVVIEDGVTSIGTMAF